MRWGTLLACALALCVLPSLHAALAQDAPPAPRTGWDLPDEVTGLAASPDGALVAAGMWGKVHLLPTGAGEVKLVTLGTMPISALTFTGDGKFLAAFHDGELDRPGAENRAVHICDPRTGKELRKVPVPSGSGAVRLFAIEGDRFAIDTAREIAVHRASDGSRQVLVRPRDKQLAADVSPDGNRWAAALETKELVSGAVGSEPDWKIAAVVAQTMSVRYSEQGTRIFVLRKGESEWTLDCRDSEHGKVVWTVPLGNPPSPIDIPATGRDALVVRASPVWILLDLARGRMIEFKRPAKLKPVVCGAHDGRALWIVRDRRVERFEVPAKETDDSSK